VSGLSDFTTLTSPELIEDIEVHLPRSTKRHPPEPRAVGPRPPAEAPPAAPPKPSATQAGAPGTVAVSTILFDVCPIKNHKTHQNHLKHLKTSVSRGFPTWLIAGYLNHG